MRVISGSWRGQPLRTLTGTRATTDRVREAIFSILGDAGGLEILDLYAGSGALGIEALSRGARAACFVDLSRRAISCIQSNLKGKSAENVRLICQDSLKFLRADNSSFDWIFCDPPYDRVDLTRLINALAASAVVGTDSLIILETDRYHTVNLPSELTRIDQRKFGETLIHFIRRTDTSTQELTRA